MGWMDVLRQYRDAPAAPPANSLSDFEQVAREVPREDLSAGLEEAFRSEQTPPMEQMMSRLFEHSNAEQRAGFLNHMLDGLGSGALATMGGSAADLVRRAARTRSAIIPDEAQDVPPQDVEAIGRVARDDPSLLQRAARFYAQHPQLVQVLGQAALGVAMNAMAQRRRI